MVESWDHFCFDFCQPIKMSLHVQALKNSTKLANREIRDENKSKIREKSKTPTKTTQFLGNT